MKVPSYILPIILLSYFVCNHDLITGTYSGENKNGFQELTLNSDNTFTYKFRDNIASLVAGSTQGIWYIKRNKLILSSEHQLDEFKIEEQWIDSISGSLIQIENLSGEPIWELNSVIINKDTTEVKNFRLTNYKWDEQLDSCLAKFDQSGIRYITILEGAYPIFKYETKNKKVNYLKITGNFANESWYRYFNEVQFKIGRNKLKGPDQFGKFKLIHEKHKNK